MTQNLDRRTDRQHRRAAGRCALQAPMGLKMPGGQPLGAILSTTQRVEIKGVGHRVGQRDLDDLGGNSAQSQPLTQHDSIAAVTVGSHHIGQQQPDSHRLSHASVARFGSVAGTLCS